MKAFLIFSMCFLLFTATAHPPEFNIPVDYITFAESPQISQVNPTIYLPWQK